METTLTKKFYKAFGENSLNIIIETGDDLRSILSEKNEIFLRGRNSGCCAARDVLRMNKIVIIGETTSNIDKVTDLIIQNIARNNLECTMLSIAHRLRTVIQNDIIIAIDKYIISLRKLSDFPKERAIINNITLNLIHKIPILEFRLINKLYLVELKKHCKYYKYYLYIC